MLEDRDLEIQNLQGKIKLSEKPVVNENDASHPVVDKKVDETHQVEMVGCEDPPFKETGSVLVDPNLNQPISNHEMNKKVTAGAISKSCRQTPEPQGQVM